jgi:hypothetical protein
MPIDLAPRFRFNIRESMVVVAILAIDFAFLPPRYSLSVICAASVLTLLEAIPRVPTTTPEPDRRLPSTRLLCTLAIYATINIIAVAIAAFFFRADGDWVWAVFASYIPACFAFIVAFRFITEHIFNRLSVFIVINALANLSYANYMYALIYRSAV